MKLREVWLKLLVLPLLYLIPGLIPSLTRCCTRFQRWVLYRGQTAAVTRNAGRFLGG